MYYWNRNGLISKTFPCAKFPPCCLFSIYWIMLGYWNNFVSQASERAFPGCWYGRSDALFLFVIANPAMTSSLAALIADIVHLCQVA